MYYLMFIAQVAHWIDFGLGLDEPESVGIFYGLRDAGTRVHPNRFPTSRLPLFSVL